MLYFPLLKNNTATELLNRYMYTNAPVFDVDETDDVYELQADVPGATDLDVSLKENQLTVSGQRNALTFSRVFTIPDKVDRNKISASLKDGVLKLILPKRVEAKPIKIMIKR